MPAEDSVKRVAEAAKRMELSGLGVAHEYEGKEGLTEYLGLMDRIDKEVAVDLVRCCAISSEDPGNLKKDIGKVRQKVELVAVKGGEFEINKAAAEDSRVDLLLHPEYKRKDPGMDHKTTKMAAENDVTVCFVFHDLHQTYGKVRSHVFNHIKKSIELCQKYDAEFMVSSGARDEYGLRGGRDLASLLMVLGVETREAINSVTSIPENIVEENRSKLKGKVKRGGVREL